MIFDETEDTENPPADSDIVSESETADAAEEQAPAADEAPEAEAEAPAEEPAEPEVQLTPKERRAQKRNPHTGEAQPQRTIEERTALRLAKRKKNADERRRYRAKSREKRKGSGEGTPPAERGGTGAPRERLGIVVSDKSNKTITVRIDHARQHRTYGKIVRTTTKLAAHDERNEASEGDTVRLIESRPLSKNKRWRLIEVVERAR